MKHIRFPSIEQFRTIVKNINDHTSYVGQGEDGKPIYNYLKYKPTIQFTGTVKCHGTSAAVCFNNIDGLWVQSRENIITLEKDNMSCAFYVMQNKDAWMDIIVDLVNEYNIDVNTHTICIYFEWCGKGIQKGVAISELDKMAVIFSSFKVSPIDEDEVAKGTKWYPTSLTNCTCDRPANKIYNIKSFKTYSIDIDFNEPQLSQNKIIEYTLEVEEECPVGKAFDVNGIGEGIVWEANYLDTRYVFKSKGEKHANSKVKTMAPVDMDKLNKVQQCVEDITHNWRFEQALTEIFGIDYEKIINKSKMGDYLRWVATDTLKEEGDIITSYEFEPKDVMGHVQNKAKKYFLEIAEKV